MASRALIVGASRGLGLGLAREFLSRDWEVIGTVRAPAAGSGLHALGEGAGGRLTIETADVAEAESLRALAGRIDAPLDVLMVNAGVGDPGGLSFEELFFRVMTVNALGAITAVRVLADRVADGGAIGVMTSQLGSIAQNTTGGYEPYRASKAALNQLLRSFSAEHADAPWSVSAIHPGWVRTDMGGPQAPLDVETSVRGVADVLESRRGQRGCVFLDWRGQTLPW